MAERPARTTLSVVDDDVPRRLRAEREHRGISLRELARRLDISPSAISQIETGRARPSVATLWAIVTELGMSLDDLFAGRPLVYRPSGAGYLLYSVGVNGKDEGGRWTDDDPPGDDLRVRMPLPDLKPAK